MNAYTEKRIKDRNRLAEIQAEERGAPLSFAQKIGLGLANTLDACTSFFENGYAVFFGGSAAGGLAGAFYGLCVAALAIACFSTTLATVGPLIAMGACAAGTALGGMIGGQSALDDLNNNTEGRLSDQVAKASGAIKEKPFFAFKTPEENIAAYTGQSLDDVREVIDTAHKTLKAAGMLEEPLKPKPSSFREQALESRVPVEIGG
jgi:hypothetical protein